MRGTRTLTLAVLALLATRSVAAQTVAAETVAASPAPLVRADIYGTLGWFNAETSLPYDDWYNRSLHGAAGLGWYWTDHLRTELQFAATTTAETYSSEPVIVGGQQTFVGFRQTFATRKLGIGQHYQFYRNAWFHPHVGAGVDVTRETVQRIDDPIFVFDPSTRQGRQGRGPQAHPPVESTEVRPFLATGFKAYMTQRAFFRSDLQVGVRRGVDEVLLRFGFGLDF